MFIVNMYGSHIIPAESNLGIRPPIILHTNHQDLKLKAESINGDTPSFSSS
jgi:hypothetical protein